ncbi:MAG: hypothetical protein Tsb008_16150 [Rhodothalassiaceae bacterium]
MTRLIDQDPALLIALVEQARLQGANLPTLGALVEEASEQGALRALRTVGLADRDAGSDIRALRGLLEAYREARRTVWHSILRWATTCLILALIAGLSMKLRFFHPAP